MSDLLSRRLRAIANSESSDLLELVKLAGLDPRKDLRHADLSGADLRGVDLSAFDLAGANLAGAMLQGAKLGKSVSQKQLSSAILSAPVIVLSLGEGLASDEFSLSDYLGTNVYVPMDVQSAVRLLADDPERRLRRTGTYIGDNSDLVRRRLSRPFRELRPALRRAKTCFIILEPRSDLDFDALGVVLRYLERDGINPFVFVLPHAMPNAVESGEAIITTRLRAVPEELRMSLGSVRAANRTKLISKPTQLLSIHERAIEKLVGFLWVVANSRMVALPNKHRGGMGYMKGEVFLSDGIRRSRESLAACILREVRNAYPNEYYDAERHHIAVREDLYSGADLAAVVQQLAGQRAVSSMAVFPRRADMSAEFYALSGPSRSGIWAALTSAARPLLP